GRAHRAVHLRRRVAKRGVDEPSLALPRPNRPAEPRPGIVVLPVPFEVADVSRFEVDGVAVMGTQDRDARVGTVEHRSSFRATRSVRQRGASITWQVIRTASRATPTAG